MPVTCTAYRAEPRTGAEPVLVEISGFGPTDTRYFDPANTPKAPGDR
jgi:hypothetical protein